MSVKRAPNPFVVYALVIFQWFAEKAGSAPMSATLPGVTFRDVTMRQISASPPTPMDDLAVSSPSGPAAPENQWIEFEFG